MAKLSPTEIETALANLPSWSLDNGEIVRTFDFPDFIQSMVFVNHVAALAEQAGHHPDIDIRYNKVRLALATHSAGGLTDKDFALAARIDNIPTQ